MKLALRDLVASEAPLQRLLPGKIKAPIAFRLARIITCVLTEMRDYERVRLMLCKRFGKLSKKGDRYKFSKKKLPAFTAELGELLNTQVELEVILTAEEDLPEMSVADAIVLWWLVEESEAKEVDGEPTDEPRI